MRYIFFIILELIYLVNVLSGNYYFLLLALILVLVLRDIRAVEKALSEDQPLFGRDRWKVLLFEFFEPVVAGAFYYYCWKKRFPKRASQANRYSWLIVGLQVLLYLVATKLWSLVGGSAQF